jgi:hypothetical protein
LAKWSFGLSAFESLVDSVDMMSGLESGRREGQVVAFWCSLHRRWRVFVKLLMIAALVSLIGVYLEMRANYKLCDLADSRSLPGPNGQTIELETRFCGVLAGDPGTVVVRLKNPSDDRDALLLAYTPSILMAAEADTPWYPQVVWIGANKVSISTGRISHLQKKRLTVGNVRVAYQIGRVDYPNPS